MKKLWNWLNNTSLGKLVQSYVKVFVTTVLALFLADGANVFAVSVTELKTWLAAALASVLPPLLTALNPNDPRFGLTKKVTVSEDKVYPVIKKDSALTNPLPEVKKPAARKTASKKVSG